MKYKDKKVNIENTEYLYIFSYDVSNSGIYKVCVTDVYDVETEDIISDLGFNPNSCHWMFLTKNIDIKELHYNNQVDNK